MRAYGEERDKDTGEKGWVGLKYWLILEVPQTLRKSVHRNYIYLRVYETFYPYHCHAVPSRIFRFLKIPFMKVYPTQRTPLSHFIHPTANQITKPK